ncbi:MAG: Flp pilus assembly complex ATPase component TadA, partial [Deltaproteobacteria bacterium]|nr:Flp pilus assembly complex ATPase component TadA [Deltaproteobacteria bacterium]
MRSTRFGVITESARPGSSGYAASVGSCTIVCPPASWIARRPATPSCIIPVSSSGKSTTLAALIGLLDQRRAAHVITLEDPIEYRFAPQRCLIHQRELGIHVPTFAAGLKAALREAPDVILLGELRDKDTIAAALTAAETGHLVLATLHAPNAAGAIDRMIDAFADTQQRQVRWQLAGVLRTVITQYLLPR